MRVSISDVVSLLALALSSYATWRSHRFKAKEEELIDLQLKVSSLVLEKEQREAKQSDRAELDANFLPVGVNKHRLKIFNKGKGPAFGVTIKFFEDTGVVPESEIKNKFPTQRIDPGKGVELIANFHLGTKEKHAIRLKWKDEDGSERQKNLYLTR
ncbi:hypothetical protein [Desulfosoma caldarium]|uniref:Uncharacterized protein n=1 Tax=Desulfosoma caldarium TaxID=610254 RepID=A0A3N1VLJ7_9BACT|nr:hypothetical protein [Desulfosoma caldarium]ROR02919.1 hypothetical protein EDC27_0161 [Desulfosoma caldarium]